ncbi:MAG TPA: TetR/AcrR family transcriptional regulator [Bacillales bacterium]|nr:TetR/AcrR family transcriptional regulator [Bacillales bacterium]
MADPKQMQSIYELSVEDNQLLTEKQKQILAAAIEMFSKKGYAASSTSEIAKKAGVAEGTIFRHYQTKKDLLLAIVTPVMSHVVAPFLIRDVNKVLHKNYETAEDFIRAFLLNRKIFIEKNLPMLKILLQEIPFHDDLRVHFLKHVAGQPFARMQEVIGFYQEKGQIRDDLPPSAVLRLAGSSIAGHLLTRFVIASGGEWDSELEINRTIEYIMRGIGTN